MSRQKFTPPRYDDVYYEAMDKIREIDDAEPAAAPTPVEPKCGQCGHLESRHRLGWPPEACLGATDTDMCLCQKFHVASAAQPVEGPREKCAHTLNTWWKGEGWIQQCTKCGLYFDPSETPSEPADDYRVTVDASYLKSLLRRPPAPVEGPRCCDKPPEYLGDGWMGHADGDCAAPVEGVERATDDRTADTIRSKPYNSADELARSVEELLAENARAETRIEVLEAALRLVEHKLDQFIGGQYNQAPYPSLQSTLEVVRAALAATGARND